MWSKNLLIVVLVLIATTVSAQVIKSQAAFRMLQTANTLLEAKQFEAAEEYYRSGLFKAIQNKDSYCEAFANEGLGNLFTKLEQPDSAIWHYQVAVKLYKNQKLTVIATLVESLLKSVQGIGDLYAGIEIGAKGIKLSVIDVKLSKDREYGYTLKLDTAINTDAASLSYQSEKETSDAVAILLDIINSRFKIPANKIYVVVSSGLRQELDKYNKLEYFESIIRPKGMDVAIKITSITPEQEAELSVLGIIPQRHRFTAGQLDIGSGNTKGGYFTANKIFEPITFSLGTKSFQRLVESTAKGDVNDFATMAEKLWNDSLSKYAIREFVSKREIKLKDMLYLSGGIVWAIVSLQHPEKINDNYVEITPSEIATFKKEIVQNYDKLTHPDLTIIPSPEDVKAAGKNIGRVLKTFDQKAMVAGAIWLNHLMQEITTINPAKKIIYPKYGYVGWISGYIIKKVTQQYVGLVK
ncbi:tetratricopeptide repeat protein [Ferruginibacter lapsinanis]|uniref:tetratricopeptide repeat protein n=1 Tax=Ferruginibacter lapsinanis TaxID=563172 RepID=UPI001E32688D|nr:tetratricopeptide repeat protein [Ferruginibacter lapsinanis]UEG48883.1 tetratricopeptide repeat protein [Ferruginibacter lapsinanis]